MFRTPRRTVVQSVVLHLAYSAPREEPMPKHPPTRSRLNLTPRQPDVKLHRSITYGTGS